MGTCPWEFLIIVIFSLLSYGSGVDRVQKNKEKQRNAKKIKENQRQTKKIRVNQRKSKKNKYLEISGEK